MKSVVLPRKSRGVFCVCLLLTCLSSSANELNPSSIWISYGEDDVDTEDIGLFVDLALSDDDNLQISYAHSTIPVLSIDLTTQELSLGYSTYSWDPWGVSLAYERWGNDDELIIDTASMTLQWYGEFWALGMQLEYRDIILYSRQFSSGQYRRDIYTTGIGPLVQASWSNWTFGFNGVIYDYDADLSVLNDPRTLLIISGKTLSHASQLNDWRYDASIVYQFDGWSMGLRYGQYESALTQRRSDDNTILLGIALDDDVSLELEIGETVSDQGDVTDFATINLGFYF